MLLFARTYYFSTHGWASGGSFPWFAAAVLVFWKNADIVLNNTRRSWTDSTQKIEKRGTPSGVYLFRAKLVSRMTLLLPSSSKWRISHQTRQKPSLHRVSRRLLLQKKRLQSRSISDVRSSLQCIFNHPLLSFLKPTIVIANRLYCIHMGPPFVCFNMEWP